MDLPGYHHQEHQSAWAEYPERWRCRYLKALVWFWLIDETLSANLFYQSDYEIGSTFQVVKQMKIMMVMPW